MGCFFSSSSDESPPPVPAELTAAPSEDAVSVGFSVGRLGASDNYGVYPPLAPHTPDKLWLWFKKFQYGNTIHLEDFQRDQYGNGKVMWQAEINGSPPQIDQYQMPIPIVCLKTFDDPMPAPPVPPTPAFKGIVVAQDEEDRPTDYYLSSKEFKLAFGRTVDDQWAPGASETTSLWPNIVGIPLVTKWRSVTTATITTGYNPGENTGRGSNYCGEKPLTLEVVHLGSAVTAYKQNRTHYGNGRVRVQCEKLEFSFVDRVDFRLTCLGKTIGQWSLTDPDPFVNKHNYNIDQPALGRSATTHRISTPFFQVSANGAEIVCNPAGGMDPCLALLLAHLTVNEYGDCERVKKSVEISTPAYTNSAEGPMYDEEQYPDAPKFKSPQLGPKMMSYSPPVPVSGEAFSPITNPPAADPQ